MSVVTILKGKEKWPEIYNFLKESSPSLEDFEEIGKLINGAENYFIQSYRHASEEASASDIFSAYDKDELEMFANIVKKYVKNVKVRGI